MRIIRRALAGIIAATALAGAVLLTAPAPATAAPAAAQGCGYANTTPNNGKFANTICWFDFTSFNLATARTAAGQPMTVTLNGGYTISFDVQVTNVPGAAAMTINPRATPLETRFAYGTDAYRGVPGDPALYSGPAPVGLKGGVVTLANIKVTDANGDPVTGYSFVAADTEDNVAGESFKWTSDKPIDEIERLAPNGSWGCKSPVGLGTTTVTCAGTGAGGSSIAGGKSTALLVAADSPTSFATQWLTPQQSGIAFGIQTTQVTLDKTVASRVNPSDSFDLAITSPENTTVATASTGTANSATTGSVTVLPRTTGAAYVLGETATGGTQTVLSNYAQSWSCTNATTGSTTTLPSGTGATKTLAPAIGDDITCTITNTAAATSLSIQKHAGTPVDVNGDGLVDAGDTIQYTFDVKNTGTLTMSNIGVTDAKVGAVTCPQATLTPGSSETCSANTAYTITTGDVTAGVVHNSATAQGTPPGSSTPVVSAPSTTDTPTTAPAPGLTVVKSADPSDAESFTPGQTVTYHFLVTNTGNVPVTGLTVDDTSFTGTGTVPVVTCPSSTLAPKAQEVCEASYVLTPNDVDAGSVTNTATVTGTPTGTQTPITSPPSAVTVPTPAQPGMTVVKSASPSTVTKAGQTVAYSFVVTNTGNVTLRNVSVADTDFSGSGDLSAVVCPSATLLAGQEETCTATYIVTQADVDAGSVTNTAAVTATPPNGRPLPPVPSNEARVDIPASPALSVVKTSDLTQVTKAGQVVTYTFAVTNTGNVDLTDPTVNEGAFSGHGTLSAVTCPSGDTVIAPGQEIDCTATYTVVAADLSDGELSNTATVTGTTPGGDPLTSDPSTATVAEIAPVVTPTPTPTPTPDPTVVATSGSGSGSGSGLADTGSDTWTAALVGLGLLVLGVLAAAAAWMTRRRRA